jgi:tripartite motif-containing protein 71
MPTMVEAVVFAKRLLLISAGIVCLSQLPHTADAQTFITAWGVFGPIGVAVGGSGHVYVSDPGDHSVKVFTSTGAPLGQWHVPIPPPPDNSGPMNIAVDGDDNVYVDNSVPASPTEPPGEPAGVDIQKFTSTGVLLTQFAVSWAHTPFAVDVLGTVYVSDYHHDRIQVFTSSGSYLREWNVSSGADGLTLDAAGNVYVAYPNLGFIRKFANDGTFLTQWGGGAGDGQFTPVRLAVGPDGHVFVTDFGNHRVQVFTSDGTFVTMWGSQGSAPGQFDYPLGIAVDSDGYIYVVDKNNVRIEKFGFAPTPVQSVTWGSMKARYRGDRGAARPPTQAR